MEIDKEQFNRLSAFFLITTVFSTISFVIRNLLFNCLDGHNFKLFTVDFLKNYGAAFSLFHTHTSLLVVISVAVLLLVLYYIIYNIKNFTKSEIVFSAVLTAGIICNLTERIIDGYVTDYIRLNFVMFPVFNLSDVFINIGAFILICNILFNDEQTEK